eukprot:6255197-Pyramimonas_sp.AAC.1
MLLFALALDPCIRWLCSRLPRQILAYAGDLWFGLRDVNVELPILLPLLQRLHPGIGLAANLKKCVLIHCGLSLSPRTSRLIRRLLASLGNGAEAIGWVRHARYLGVQIGPE